MKTTRRLLWAACLALGLAACQYENSIAPAPKGTIPEEILGRWKQAADPAVEGREHDSFLVIHRTRGGRLLVDYEFQEAAERVHWYFTGFPVIAGKSEWLELELVGNAKGERDVDEPYLLVKWKLEGDRLTWQLLDENKLSPGNGGPEFRKALEAAVAADKDILAEASEYRKVPAAAKDNP